MKSGKLVKHPIKIIGQTLLVLGVISFTILGYSQVNDKTQLAQNKHQAELKGDNAGKLKHVPYTNCADDNLPLIGDARVSSVRETVTGLKDAGYNLDEIVEVLKNDDKNAPQISIACLNAGYNGTKIYHSLKKCGFSTRAAEAAIPPALRTSTQMFSSFTPEPDSVAAEMAMIEANPFASRQDKDAAIQKVMQGNLEVSDNKKSGRSEINLYEVKVNVGVTFNGLGDWNNFQNQRFDNNKQ